MKVKNGRIIYNLITKRSGKSFLANAVSRINFLHRFGFLVSVTRSGRPANRLTLARTARARVEPANVFRPEKSGFAIFAIYSGGVFPAADADAAAFVLSVGVDTLTFGFNLLVDERKMIKSSNFSLHFNVLSYSNKF